MIYFVLSVDDAATKNFSNCLDFTQLLDFLKKYQVQATIFVVPNETGIPLYKKKDWVKVLQRAKDDGHDLELHGYEHNAFEFGIPPDFILAYEHEISQKLKKEREKIETNLTVGKIEERLNKGLEIFEKTLGFRPTGFRSPYLSIHKNLFIALKNCGFVFDSSIAINPKGWYYIRKDYQTEVNWFNIKPKPFQHPSGILEIPLMTEYTWYLKEEDIERQFNLAKEDLDRVEERNGVLVALSHISPMSGKYSAGLKFYEKLFFYIREKKDFSISTLSEIAIL